MKLTRRLTLAAFAGALALGTAMPAFGLLPEAMYLVAALTAFSTTQRIVHTLRQLYPQG